MRPKRHHLLARSDFASGIEAILVELRPDVRHRL